MPRQATIFSGILFWLLFFFLNCLLFLPAYVVHTQLEVMSIANGSSVTFFDKTWLEGDFNLLVKLCGDFIFLLLLLFFLKPKTLLASIYTFLVALLYLLLLYYTIYYEGYKGLYSVHPTFQNDWVIVKEVMPTFLKEISVKGSTYLNSVLLFLGISLVIFLLVKWLQQLFLKNKWKVAFWLLGILFLGGFLIQKNRMLVSVELSSDKITLADSPSDSVLVERDSNYFSNLEWIYPKIKTSATVYREEDHFANYKMRWVYDFYKNKKLVNKPNIYLLFVESYGAVASLSDYCTAPYDSLTKILDEQLVEAGWAVASNYSKSTVIGGRSWLAMTTAMIGAEVEDQIQYSGLLKDYQGYPHLIDFLNGQGYETFRMSSMRISRIDTLTMITIPNQFWQFDYRYLFPDIPYRGHQYDLYGGIPDQYSLNYAQETWLNPSKKPFFFTSITMNSHGPWHSKMPPIVDKWRNLNNPNNPFEGEEVHANMTIMNYWIAMEYELKMLVDFILKNGDKNSLFIILGDHNPGGLEFKLYKKFNKWATPIHIISKDSTFVNSFHQHGFTSGINPDTSAYTIMRHKGFYSLFARQLFENYGEKEVVLPDYLPWGLKAN